MTRTRVLTFMVTLTAIVLTLGLAGVADTAVAGERNHDVPLELRPDGHGLGDRPDSDVGRQRHHGDDDDDDDDDGGMNGDADPTPIGAWFGIARPCTPPAAGVPIGSVDPRPDPTICGIACHGEECKPNGFPFLEVTMIPTLLADGTVLADDFAELLDNHSTAQGKWTYKGKTEVDGKMLDEYRASFIWFNGALPDFGLNQAFVGSARPRFVTFFDKDNPDEMRGYIQPYLYAYTDPSPDGIGIVRVDENGFPVPNPTDPLPEACDPTDPTAQVPCLGTLHFYIRRIPAE